MAGQTQTSNARLGAAFSVLVMRMDGGSDSLVRLRTLRLAFVGAIVGNG